MIVTLMTAAEGARPHSGTVPVKHKPVKLREVYANLDRLGFNVPFWSTNFSAWTLSRLERPIYTKMLDLLGELSIYKVSTLGVASPMTLSLPSAKAITLLGESGIDKLLASETAMKQLRERAFDLNSSAVDLDTTLTFVFKTYIVQQARQ